MKYEDNYQIENIVKLDNSIDNSLQKTFEEKAYRAIVVVRRVSDSFAYTNRYKIFQRKDDVLVVDRKTGRRYIFSDMYVAERSVEISENA